MKLTQLRGNTYVIEGKTNIGLFLNEEQAILIDSGNDKDAGRKVRQILEASNITLTAIINTHSNADHIGANEYLCKYYNVDSYTSNFETFFCQKPILETMVLYGGYPHHKLKNKFLFAPTTNTKDIVEINHPFEIINLPGHFIEMIGLKTIDNVYFLADSLFSIEIIEKYHLFYIFDVQEFLNTLDNLSKITGDNVYVISHAPICNDLTNLIEVNRNKVYEVINLIKSLCNNITFDNLLKLIMDHYNLVLDHNQYVLVGSTIRNYLSYLYDCNEIEFIYEDNYLYYQLSSK